MEKENHKNISFFFHFRGAPPESRVFQLLNGKSQRAGSGAIKKKKKKLKISNPNVKFTKKII